MSLILDIATIILRDFQLELVLAALAVAYCVNMMLAGGRVRRRVDRVYACGCSSAPSAYMLMTCILDRVASRQSSS